MKTQIAALLSCLAVVGLSGCVRAPTSAESQRALVEQTVVRAEAGRPVVAHESFAFFADAPNWGIASWTGDFNNQNCPTFDVFSGRSSGFWQIGSKGDNRFDRSVPVCAAVVARPPANG
jgi:hypothetical protein